MLTIVSRKEYNITVPWESRTILECHSQEKAEHVISLTSNSLNNITVNKLAKILLSIKFDKQRPFRFSGYKNTFLLF